jgi:hypothetical protein
MADNTKGLNLAVDLIQGQTVEGMDVEKLSRAQLRDHMDARLLSRNRAINHIMGQLATSTTQRGDLIGQHAHTGEWPKATELDRGRRIRTAGLDALGYPITKFGPVRSGWSYDMLAKRTNTELLIFLDDVLAGHLTTNYNEAMRAIFRNTEYDWSDDLFKEDGTIKVKPLANADGFIPPEHNGQTFAGSHSHYVAGGTGTLDEADLVVAADHLREHGFGQSRAVGGFGGTIVTWINTAEVADVQAHTGFVAANDPFVQNINKIFVNLDQDQYLGYNTAARTLIREVPWVPADYALTFVTDNVGETPSNRFAPLRRRVPTAGDLVGIRRFDEHDYPLQESWWQDFFGYGVGNRLTAVVSQIAASYSIPTIG